MRLGGKMQSLISNFIYLALFISASGVADSALESRQRSHEEGPERARFYQRLAREQEEERKLHPTAFVLPFLAPGKTSVTFLLSDNKNEAPTLELLKEAGKKASKINTLASWTVNGWKSSGDSLQIPLRAVRFIQDENDPNRVYFQLASDAFEWDPSLYIEKKRILSGEEISLQIPATPKNYKIIGDVKVGLVFTFKYVPATGEIKVPSSTVTFEYSDGEKAITETPTLTEVSGKKGDFPAKPVKYFNW